MKEYTRLVATTLHGCRLDNCHSTPLWFAQELMDYARQINPDFYINAELFTGNIQTDTQFINQIGINSLVKGMNQIELFRKKIFSQITDTVGEGTK
jgi:glycogen debranching enzyme